MDNKLVRLLKIIGLPLGIALLVFAGVFLILNFVVNLFVAVFQNMFGSGEFLEIQDFTVDASMFYTFDHVASYMLILGGIVFISAMASVLIAYKIVTNFGRLKKNQKGSARFTTFKEIKQQYRDVPDKGEKFPGGGGVPIARYKDRLFIDDSPVNNLIIGTTRSGKGETFVFSAIDIYSRAEKQASMILNDPKGELYAASKDTLESLGYHVEVLNLMNTSQSMSYNLLQLTIDAFMEGNFSLAQQYARSVAFMLYYDPKAKDPFWSNSATDLCTAMILALCEQCRDEPHKINMYNVAMMLSELGTKSKVDPATGKETSALDDFFNDFPENHPAKMQYATINFSSGQTRASIMANANAKLGVYTLDGTAKLTSRNSYDMTKIGFGRWIKGKTKPNTRVHLTFPNNNKETIRTDSDGAFILYHKNPLKVGDEVLAQIGDTETKITITGERMVKTVDGTEKFEGHMAVTADNEEVVITEVMEYDKPTAIFMIVPDYDETFNVIASLYVKQVYTNLARIASNSEGGKCHREVIFLLDEFGNMPPIEGMANMITVCLGRNIRFNLVIQAYSQLENLYGEQWKTIDGNCGNTLYLLTADESTAEIISKKLGEETIVVKSRSGQTVSLNKSKTENVDSRRLMTSTEVMGLKEGEMLVLRVIKRQDKNRKRIKSYPIYLTGKTALKYRWEYLSDYYNTDKSINDIDIPCEHTMLNLSEIKADFSVNQYRKREMQRILKERQDADARRREEERQKKQQEESSAEQKEQAKTEEAAKPGLPIKEDQVKDVLNEGLLLGMFKDKKLVERYKVMTLPDFRDLLLSMNHEIEEQLMRTMLNMIEKNMETGENKQ